EIAAGRQDIEAAARRRARWAGRHEPTGKTGEQAGEFTGAALHDGGAEFAADEIEHGGGPHPFGIRWLASPDGTLCEQFQALDRVAEGAPRVVTAEALRAWTFPSIAQRCRQRVEAKVEIVGERADERGVLPFAAAARQARERHQKVGQLLVRRRDAED